MRTASTRVAVVAALVSLAVASVALAAPSIETVPPECTASLAAPCRFWAHHRELLGKLSQAAETVKELLAAAAMEEKGFRPGLVAVVQTFPSCERLGAERGRLLESPRGAPVLGPPAKTAVRRIEQRILSFRGRRS